MSIKLEKELYVQSKIQEENIASRFKEKELKIIKDSDQRVEDVLNLMQKKLIDRDSMYELMSSNTLTMDPNCSIMKNNNSKLNLNKIKNNEINQELTLSMMENS